MNGTTLVISGLNPGTTYFYQVRAANASGSSANSGTITTLTLPSAPVATASTSITTTGFTANWGTVSGATSYRLDVSASQFADFVTGYNNLTVAGTSQAVTGLTAGGTYYVRVRAVNATGASDNSNTVTTFTVPNSVVANAATSISTTGLTANWNLVSGALTYYLDVATDNAFGSVLGSYNNLPVGGNFQIVTGLSSGTTYFYRVRASNVAGTTGNSNIITTVTLPVSPTANAATVISATGFTANWTSVTGATQYNLDLSTDNSFASILSQPSATGNSVAITGLLPGTNYYYRVRASNASGNSLNSGTINVLTLPDAPVANSATSITSTTFLASWNSIASAASYRLDVATTNTFTAGTFVSGFNDLTVATTSATVTLPTPGATYFYRVRAVSIAGTSANSNVISTLIKPSSPTANSATVITETSFTANWSAVSGVTGYFLDVSSNNFSSQLASYDNLQVPTTSLLVSGLSGLNPGTTYQYRVRSYNTTGSSANSSTIATVTISPKPVALQATNFTTTSFTANWQATQGASSYRLDVSSDDFATFVINYNDKTVSATSDNVTGLTAGVAYKYRVRAVNLSGTSINSDAISSVSIPPAPAGLTASAVTTNNFTVNWSAATGAANYLLDVSTNSFGTFVGSFNNFPVAGTSQSQVITGLSAGTAYQVRVRASNTAGASAYTSTLTQQTLPADPTFQPTALSFGSISTTGMNVSFTASVGGAAGYIVVRRIGSSPTGSPADGTTYSLGNNLGDGTVAFVGSGTSFTETGLLAGLIYFYDVFAFNGSGVNTNYLNTTPLEGSQITLPDAPTLAATTNIVQSVTTNGFTVNWTGVTGASNYAIDVTTTTDFSVLFGSYNNLLTGNTTSFAVTGLDGGTTYRFRLRAIDAAGASANSLVGTVLTIPVSPIGLTTSAVTSTGFTASWSASATATSYRFDVSTNSSFSILPVDNVQTTDTSFPFTGLVSSTQYYVRIRAINASGTSINSSTATATTTAGGGGPTTLEFNTLDFPAMIKSSAVPVSVKAVGGTDPKVITFNHRKIADASFVSEAVSLKTGTSDTYEVSVTTAITDVLGIEFFFSATDAGTQTAQTLHKFIYRAVDANSTSNNVVPFADNKFNGKPSTYQMFSIPYVLSDNNIANLFDPALKGFSDSRWRLLHYKGAADGKGGYIEYPKELKKIELGEGYWFNTTEKDFEIKLINAQVRSDITQSSPFTITLQKGWNQIGDPYTFNVDWNVIQDANPDAGLNSLWLFEGGKYLKKDVLASWKGAFVFSDNGGLVTFPLSAKTDAPGREPSEFTDPVDGQWILPMTLSAGDLQATFAPGMHNEASSSKDKYDEMVVPRFIDYVEMRTYHPEFFAPEFAVDVIPSSLSYTWEYTLNTNSGASHGSMEWDMEKLKNLSASFLLLDVHNQALVNMKTVSSYHFQIANKQQFKIIMRSGDFNPGVTSLNTAYPNPFVNTVNIPVYTETDNANVSVTIYNMMGQQVKTLQSNFNESGYYELHWDGASSEPTMPANGVLLYKVIVNGVPTSLKRLIKD